MHMAEPHWPRGWRFYTTSVHIIYLWERSTVKLFFSRNENKYKIFASTIMNLILIRWLKWSELKGRLFIWSAFPVLISQLLHSHFKPHSAFLIFYFFLLTWDLSILTVHDHIYRWSVSECSVSTSVLWNVSYQHIDTFLHESSVSTTTTKNICETTQKQTN